MTTSGSYAFNQNRDQIIKSALRKIGAIAAGEIPNSQLMNDAAAQLNSMVKHFMATGIHLWTVEEAIMYTNIGQAMYILGPGSSTPCYQVAVQTTLSEAANPGATTFYVESVYGMVVGNKIGIVLADGTTAWLTISSIDTGLNTVVASTPIDDYALFGTIAYGASYGIQRPLRIPAARRWSFIGSGSAGATGGIDTPMTAISRLDYDNLPQKNLQGTVTQFYYNPRGGAVDSGALYLWPTPSDSINNNIKFTWYRPIQTFDNAANTPDFPQEWIEVLTWNLAQRMGPEYGTPEQVMTRIDKMADQTLEVAMGWDREPESTYFGVDFSQMFRS